MEGIKNRLYTYTSRKQKVCQTCFGCSFDQHFFESLEKWSQPAFFIFFKISQILFSYFLFLFVFQVVQKSNKNIFKPELLMGVGDRGINI